MKDTDIYRYLKIVIKMLFQKTALKFRIFSLNFSKKKSRKSRKKFDFQRKYENKIGPVR